MRVTGERSSPPSDWPPWDCSRRGGTPLYEAAWVLLGFPLFGPYVGVAIAFRQTASPALTVACWYFAVRGRAARDLMGFLADAHERHSMLRRVGAVYRFRHLDFRRHLANRPWGSAGQQRIRPREADGGWRARRGLRALHIASVRRRAGARAATGGRNGRRPPGVRRGFRTPRSGPRGVPGRDRPWQRWPCGER